MKPSRHYSRAPIVEAIIDLRVELSPDMKAADLSKVNEGLESEYPVAKTFNVAVGRFGVGREVSASTKVDQVGFRFYSTDAKQIYQAQLNGFALSRLAPYENWEPFHREARRLWNRYCAVTSPARVVRIAVRYVNRLDLPLPVRELKDYLRTVPEVSPELPQGLSGCFMRLVIPQEDIQAELLLNEALIEPASPGVASVVLDIDVYRTEALPQNDDELWGLFEVLRARKNEVFEACITDQARELFK